MGRSQPARANDFVVAVVRLFEPCGPQPRAAEARKRAPQAAPDIPYKVDASTFAAKTIVPTLRRIHSSDCFTTPASGYRHNASGALTAVGDGGWWWSSSSFAAGLPNAGDIGFRTTNVNPLNSDNRSNALSVRCVQHLRKLFRRLLLRRKIVRRGRMSLSCRRRVRNRPVGGFGPDSCAPPEALLCRVPKFLPPVVA